MSFENKVKHNKFKKVDLKFLRKSQEKSPNKSTRLEMEWIIFNYMSEGLFSLPKKSIPIAKISNWPGSVILASGFVSRRGKNNPYESIIKNNPIYLGSSRWQPLVISLDDKFNFLINLTFNITFNYFFVIKVKWKSCGVYQRGHDI